jgi:leader peptidase (prepilin peptidase) / N-methyltransferase
MATFDTRIWAEVPGAFWAAVFFVLGSIVGSFLNVCIHRLPRGESIISPPSHCPHCAYEIPWYLNIPLLTWLLLRGRCANCQAPISARYFVVELMTAVCFWGCWMNFGAHSPALALLYCLLIAGFIVASFIDYEHLIIPDQLTFGGMIVGFVSAYAIPALHGTHSSAVALQRSALGIAFGAGLFYTVLRLSKWFFGRHRFALPAESLVVFGETGLKLPDREIAYEEVFYRKSDAILLHAKTVRLGKFQFRFRARPVKWGTQFRAKSVQLLGRHYTNVTGKLTPETLWVGPDCFHPSEINRLEAVTDQIIIPREGLGLGDVKFMGAVGAFLGWKGVAFSLFASAIIGASISIPIILICMLLKREWSSQIPYGPYLAMAATLWIFAGDKMLKWLLTF